VNMSVSRRGFLATGAAAFATAAQPDTETKDQLDGYALARKQTIVRELATPNFFEGMLLGNGDIGVCVTVRPDALGLHLGKEDAWDIRVSNEHAHDVLRFKDVLAMWERASEEAKRQGKPDMTYLESKIDFFREYTDKVTASYSKSWPRPWPCGIVWIHWDPRVLRVARQTLDLSNGLFRLELGSDAGPVSLSAFVNTQAGHVCVYSDRPAPLSSIAYYPNMDASAELPPPEIQFQAGDAHASFSAFQLFPATAPTADVPHPPASSHDRNFALHGTIHGKWNAGEQDKAAAPHIHLAANALQTLRVDVMIMTPRDHPDTRSAAKADAERLSRMATPELLSSSGEFWRDYWSKSAVQLADRDLEQLWYRNQYWLACCLREGKIAPGLFGNWTSGKIGTAWHGDYHLNYNTQQVFWGVFSSNHVDQHLPYIDLCERLLPLAQEYAHNKFELPGAFFPHSAYPVPSQTIAYPAPPWGYEVCETPWTVQSLWWHYLYTLDDAVLRRVYPLLKAATDFLAAYVKKGADGKYHITPTVSPENWGFTVDYRLNQDCIMDLALTRFVLSATAKAAEILGRDAGERNSWMEIRDNLADYPRTKGPSGEVWVDVRNAPAEWVYNIPTTLAPVFPGEQAGIGTGEEHRQIARRTAETIRLEGGNDIVFQPLIRARLGMLDVNWFKREVRYCTLPNGVVQDRARQINGRYTDATDFDFMMRMGIWTENLSLPVVLNECMMQSYTGTIHLFPNTKNLGAARFQNLRAAGAFLVSAVWNGNKISNATILSERGAECRISVASLSGNVSVTRLSDGKPVELDNDGETIRFHTVSGERYRLAV
jgi:alpha-L-fucosidase 2